MYFCYAFLLLAAKNSQGFMFFLLVVPHCLLASLSLSLCVCVCVPGRPYAFPVGWFPFGKDLAVDFLTRWSEQISAVGLKGMQTQRQSKESHRSS